MTFRAETPRCGRRIRQEPHGPCQNPVERKGDACRFHGGAAPQVKAKRERRRRLEKAAEAVRTYGLPVDIDPADALLEEVHRTAGHVAYLHNLVGDLDQTELRQYAGGEHGGRWEMAVWVGMYQAERAHLVNVCKAAVAAGIEERRVKLAEAQGNLVGDLLRAAIEAMGVTSEQQQRGYEALRNRLSIAPRVSA